MKKDMTCRCSYETALAATATDRAAAIRIVRLLRACDATADRDSAIAILRRKWTL